MQPGDSIGIIATAKKVETSQIFESVRVFENWGLLVETGKHLYSEDNQFAGTDEERAKDLQEMLYDKSIRAIVCVRGGYGTTRILDQIDFSSLLHDPKWIVGFSDVTAIHCHLNNLGVESIHGIMPLLFGSKGSESSIESLRLLLFGQEKPISCTGHYLNRLGNCSGQIIGGNLSLIVNLIGTASGIDTQGKILFLEDIDEYLYHIDRMMVQLDRTGMLEGLAGLIVGHMTDINDNAIPFGKNSYQIIHNHINNSEIARLFPLLSVNNIVQNGNSVRLLKKN